MVVQQNLEFLRDAFDSTQGKFKQGASTVTSGNTTVVVSHALGAASYQVSLTPLADPQGRFWITGKSATQFTINLQVAAPVAGVSFDWIVKGA